MTAPAAVAVDADQHNPFPFELLAFSLADGRSGVLSFRWVLNLTPCLLRYSGGGYSILLPYTVPCIAYVSHPDTTSSRHEAAAVYRGAAHIPSGHVDPLFTIKRTSWTS